MSYSEGGNHYTVGSDYLGTPKVMMDLSGNSVWAQVMSPYGESQVHEDLDGDGNRVVLNLRFPGQYADQESGAYYNFFRDYDPSLGRYVQSDPIGLRGGLNTYAYVGGNPLMYTDPLGLVPPSNIPPGVNIQQNIAEASNMSPFEFYDAVRNGGRWDYKQQGSQYEAFGNYNYGLTGRAAGFPGNVLNRAAGWAQGYKQLKLGELVGRIAVR
ncbi:hypothetical protein Maes01_02797 [Microbulbifer aestuariivivens]|uniref:RHS repeat-associated core domain-containing protein n=1 Tax=Microbulbifer aestuariivivens TaxID=1908308 RepID=A0ABP9WUC3_9GAMM